MFAPYATVNTNLIFFEKKNHSNQTNQKNNSSDNNFATKEIWYYEHTLPEGAKAYNKTKPIRIEEFDPIKKWWKKRTESEVSWKVPIDTIIERGYDLDIKNPNKVVEEITYDRRAIINKIEKNQFKILEILEELKSL